MRITEVVTAPRSLWQNAFVERVIGSIRCEGSEHGVIFSEGPSARRPVLVYRLLPPNPHPSFARQGLPGTSPVTPSRIGRVTALPLVSGLHHCYERPAKSDRLIITDKTTSATHRRFPDLFVDAVALGKRGLFVLLRGVRVDDLTGEFFNRNA